MHYFKENNQKKDFKIIEFENLKFETHSNIFANSKIDFASKLLFESLNLEKKSNLLDVGCGYGIIGIYLKNKFDIEVDMIDINKDAVELSKINCLKNNVKINVFVSDCYLHIDKKYDYIVTNPPIHAGKEVVHTILFDAINYLNESGSLIFVMNKKHGLKSTLKLIEEVYSKYEILNKGKDFKVVRAFK